ncbi:hypothetical protein STENM327S_04505 [Streptomyces tendae]
MRAVPVGKARHEWGFRYVRQSGWPVYQILLTDRATNRPGQRVRTLAANDPGRGDSYPLRRTGCPRARHRGGAERPAAVPVRPLDRDRPPPVAHPVRRRTPGSDDHAPDDARASARTGPARSRPPAATTGNARPSGGCAPAWSRHVRRLPGADPSPGTARPPCADPGPARRSGSARTALRAALAGPAAARPHGRPSSTPHAVRGGGAPAAAHRPRSWLRTDGLADAGASGGPARRTRRPPPARAPAAARQLARRRGGRGRAPRGHRCGRCCGRSRTRSRTTDGRRTTDDGVHGSRARLLADSLNQGYRVPLRVTLSAIRCGACTVAR